MDLADFDFASLTRHDDPMFVPGSVRYLGIDGLLSLCFPHRLTMAAAADTKVARKVYSAASSDTQIQLLPKIDRANLTGLLSGQDK